MPATIQTDNRHVMPSGTLVCAIQAECTVGKRVWLVRVGHSVDQLGVASWSVRFARGPRWTSPVYFPSRDAMVSHYARSFGPALGELFPV